MKKIALNLCLLGISAVFLICSSCEEMQDEMPYIISVPSVHLEGNPGFYDFCGIEFSLYNSSEKTIQSLDISCYIYPQDEKNNILSHSNKVESRFTDTILPKTSKQFAVSLDSRIYRIPEKPFLVDFLTIPVIRFSDGSAWRDPLCLFYTRSY